MTVRNGWTMLVIPAIATEDVNYQTGPSPSDIHRRRAGDVLLPSREPKAVLDEMRRAIGTMTFAAQYQQNPIPSDGNIIQREWLMYYQAEPGVFDRLVSTWDLASTTTNTSSFSVGQLWGVLGSEYYLLENERVRLEMPGLRRLMINRLTTWEPNLTIVEDTELGRSMVQDLRDTTDLQPLKLKKPLGSKTVRLEAQAPRFESGQVYLPADAHWLGGYIHELLSFPFGTYNDQVDATSMALECITRSEARRRPLKRRNPTRR